MLDQEGSAKQLLKKVYEQQTDSVFKEQIKLFMNKSKDELVDILVNPEKYQK
jgi:hypothetical protein